MADGHQDFRVLQLFKLRLHLQEQVIFAGDTIYDDQLTEAFLRCSARLLQLPRMPVLFVAMEKRWNFTLRDMVKASLRTRGCICVDQ